MLLVSSALVLYIHFCVLFNDILPDTTLSEESVSLIGEVTNNISIMTSGEPTSGISDSELIFMSYFILIACNVLLGHVYLIAVVIGVVVITYITMIIVTLIITIILCVRGM